MTFKQVEFYIVIAEGAGKAGDLPRDDASTQKGPIVTDDEKKIAAIEKRAIYDGGYVTLVDDDYRTLLASRLAWKFTAKCFAAVDKSKHK